MLNREREGKFIRYECPFMTTVIYSLDGSMIDCQMSSDVSSIRLDRPCLGDVVAAWLTWLMETGVGSVGDEFILLGGPCIIVFATADSV
jgi:hypothetical protein